MGKGKEEWVRAMICDCGERLEADDDERLVQEVSTHLKWIHPDHLVATLSREQVRRVLADRAYKLEYALIYEGDEPDEEFGLDPY
jgi:hypothetical protein